MGKNINGSVEEHIHHIYEQLEKLSKQSEDARKLAEHSYRGNVESSVEIRAIKEDMKRVEENQEKISREIAALDEKQYQNLAKAVAWLVGTMIALLTMQTAIIIFVLPNLVAN